MNDTKKWYTSKTQLSAIIGTLALLAMAFDVEIWAEEQAGLVDQFLIVIQVLWYMGAFIGRILAKKQIK